MSTAYNLSPRIMGILNTTPDSFSDGGRFLGADAAVQHALSMLDDGADIIDIGGQSTRPPGRDYGDGAAPVSELEELRRTIPVIERLHSERPLAAISIDTMKPAVAEQALLAGATIVNDVSAGQHDPAIWDVAARHGAWYIAMHGHNPAVTSPADRPPYDDVVAQVFAFLAERVAMARHAGVQQPMADVGIGFAKSPADSERLIREMDRFLDLGVPLVIGASRKAFIGHALGGRAPEGRLFGTLAAHAVAVCNGASIVRVHDVAAARDFFTIFGRLRFPTPSTGVL